MSDIDPALRGTTYEAALKGARRDEEMKRQRREAEATPEFVRQQARAMANALRGTSAPSVAAPSTPTKPLQKVTHMDAMNTLSETQIGILALGYEEQSFKPGHVGRAIGKMQDDGLVLPTETKGQWKITEKGRSAYETYLAQQAAANDQVYAKESPINLDDPALKPAFEPLDFNASPDAVKRVTEENENLKKRLTALNKSLDDMGQLADKQTNEIKTLEQRIEDLTAIKGDGRNNVGEALEYYMALIAPVIALMEQDGYAERLMGEYVTKLHAQNTTWREALIDPLIALIRRDEVINMSEDDLRRDPAYIVRYWGAIRESVKIHSDRSDEAQNRLDQKESQVEALRRQIEEMNADLRAADYNRQAAAMNAFLVCVLDELCDLMPEVQEYREAREATQRVVMKIQARPS